MTLAKRKTYPGGMVGGVPKFNAENIAHVEASNAGSKKAQVVEMLKRPDGATLKEIMAATDWQAHTVRGFIAGGLKKAGYQIESTKRDGERTYRIR